MAQQVWAFGLNSHEQIALSKAGDLVTPHCMDAGDNIGVLYAVKRDGHLYHYGGMTGRHARKLTSPRNCTITKFFGTHDGLRGGITELGQLALLENDTFTLQGSLGTCPLLADIALINSGHVAAVILTSRVENWEVLEFHNVTSFIDWYNTPISEATHVVNLAITSSTAGESRPISTPLVSHKGNGRHIQLVASSTCFALLTESNDRGVVRSTIYTWGEARSHSALGRSVDEHNPPTSPGSVSALEGLRISKIASGGYMSAALTEDRDLYLWGQAQPGRGLLIDDMRAHNDDDVKLANVISPSEQGDTMDIRDVAVGNGHVVVITQDRRVFVAGSNTNGQLGTGDAEAFVPYWKEINLLREIALGVVCGDKTTYVETIRGHIALGSGHAEANV
ncbi:RCC1/BLIP-II [Pseudovirgaria hyperparasitica]|uniref:RCC1/BLIP-II n=1 Tax=Pseudovirgaria hyperparasitica TaxID=470096 RepID=A0A6A6WF84_9PEZI|nr:RCC1/BLIP-II [Pseudovirgaria hyperparasitica]KAF2760546.1 RCC1/BLIP-II [Pseudovirgaria hyperparasitica]